MRLSFQPRSSAIRSVDWDNGDSDQEGAGLMTVVFSSGSSYDYQGVPLAVFEAWSRSPSAGRFFHMNIKDAY